MRLLICAGGTGGGVYPALAVLQALNKLQETSNVENERRNYKPEGLAKNLPSGLVVLWVGGQSGMEKDLVTRTGITFTEISAAGIHGVGIRALPGNLWRMAKGVLEARRLLKEFQPDVLFFTGGYVAIPLALASRLPKKSFSNPKIVLFVPDLEPGLALKGLSWFADHIAVTNEEAKQYFKRCRSIEVTGYPIRFELQDWSKEDARRFFGLSPEMPTLLVMGGSKGARSINQALFAALSELLVEIQVIHLCGSTNWTETEGVKRNLPPSLANCYHPFPYLHKEIGAALRAADLVVSRAGAASLGEFPYFGLPAILVPYPYAWRYQYVNARYLEKQGAAIIVQDEELPLRLSSIVKEMMSNQSRLEAMSRAMRSLARSDAASSIASILTGVVTYSNQTRM